MALKIQSFTLYFVPFQCDPSDSTIPEGEQLGPHPQSPSGGDFHHPQHSGLGGKLHGRHQPRSLGHRVKGYSNTQTA